MPTFELTWTVEEQYYGTIEAETVTEARELFYAGEVDGDCLESDTSSLDIELGYTGETDKTINTVSPTIDKKEFNLTFI